MRACFLGQNVCALGYGVAMVQTLPLTQDQKPESVTQTQAELDPKDIVSLPNRMFQGLRRPAPHHS